MFDTHDTGRSRLPLVAAAVVALAAAASCGLLGRPADPVTGAAPDVPRAGAACRPPLSLGSGKEPPAMDASANTRHASAPTLDAMTPAHLETATFALG
ncbi:MAG: hypothetical protein ACOY3Y_13765 [Acidobacteriota bacterium]